MRIEWAEPAEADLRHIFEYIARDIPVYAEHFIDRIISCVDVLLEHPRIGRCVPEAERDDIRELIFQGYRIIYLVELELITVLAVLHGSRDIKGMGSDLWP